jgi:hypothetical protein
MSNEQAERLVRAVERQADSSAELVRIAMQAAVMQPPPRISADDTVALERPRRRNMRDTDPCFRPDER